MNLESSIYLDNNATTVVPDVVKREFIRWFNKGNPSSSYGSALEIGQMMQGLRKLIAARCGINADCTTKYEVGEEDHNGRQPVSRREYKVIFTSGGSEANAMIIQSAVASYKAATALSSSMALNRVGIQRPHLVISAIEHKSALLTARMLEMRGDVEVTEVMPTLGGHIDPNRVAAAIRPNTALVCIMHANNEIGAINDIAAIGDVCARARIPFHCDAVQSFGKVPPNLSQVHIDSMAVSFHKLYGVVGAGALVIRKQLIESYGLRPLICGTQNDGLRGGTENYLALAAATVAMNYNFRNHEVKMQHLSRMKRHFYRMMEELMTLEARPKPVKVRQGMRAGTRVPPTPPKAKVAARYEDRLGTLMPYDVSNSMPGPAWVEVADEDTLRPSKGTRWADKRAANHPYTMVMLTQDDDTYLNNTIMFSIVHHTIPLCNQKIKKEMEAANIIISVGSACNTKSKYASHVLNSIGANKAIKRGVMRVSLSFDTTREEINKFVATLYRLMVDVDRIRLPD